MADLAEYFRYLDRLRDSGKTNMYASGLWLERRFKMGSERASEVVALWMETFDANVPANERAAKAKGRNTMKRLIVAALTITLLMTQQASAELCFNKPQPNVSKKGGYKWLKRDVDGRTCWYYSAIPLPHWELLWTYTEEEFNSDVDRVIERKFYKPRLDENQLLVEDERK